jgi:hypothetical protein
MWQREKRCWNISQPFENLSSGESQITCAALAFAYSTLAPDKRMIRAMRSLSLRISAFT